MPSVCNRQCYVSPALCNNSVHILTLVLINISVFIQYQRSQIHLESNQERKLFSSHLQTVHILLYTSIVWLSYPDCYFLGLCGLSTAHEYSWDQHKVAKPKTMVQVNPENKQNASQLPSNKGFSLPHVNIYDLDFDLDFFAICKIVSTFPWFPQTLIHHSWEGSDWLNNMWTLSNGQGRE